MIDTVILDVGNVLVRYDWKGYLKRFNFNDAVNDKIAKAMFLSNEWSEFDRGKLSTSEMLNRFIHNCPKLKKEIEMVFEKVEESVEGLDYVIPWIKSLKRNYEVFILSNYAG